jgi:ABC-type glycerol-3-phosphate transport system substrate-binding protein
VQDKEKVVVIYKDDPAASLYSLNPKDRDNPSLIVAPGLHSVPVTGSFRQVTKLFTKGRISRGDFYPQLLDIGNVNGGQYLLPLSFNLPAVIFDPANSAAVPDDYMLTLDQLLTAGKDFNRQDNRGAWTAMGFAPSWSPEFLYLATNFWGANYRGVNRRFTWDDTTLTVAVDKLRAWTTDANGSTANEQDFASKYLLTPPHKQVLGGYCLFAYTTSDALFSVPPDALALIDFRWLHQDRKIPLSDSLVYAAVPKHAPLTLAAYAFLEWILREDTQALLLERGDRTGTFGFAGGFSSLVTVNDRVFPARYPQLLGNIPLRNFIAAPEVLPSRWSSIKAQVLLPYLEDAVNTLGRSPVLSLNVRHNEWSKGPR